NPKKIKIFDKIERPDFFLKSNQISDEDIASAWHKLLAYLNKYNLDLDVLSPNVSIRELYRFATEELFEEEIDDMDMPDMICHFIYDEFYPDPIYDNTRIATDQIK